MTLPADALIFQAEHGDLSVSLTGDSVSLQLATVDPEIERPDFLCFTRGQWSLLVEGIEGMLLRLPGMMRVEVASLNGMVRVDVDADGVIACRLDRSRDTGLADWIYMTGAEWQRVREFAGGARHQSVTDR